MLVLKDLQKGTFTLCAADPSEVEVMSKVVDALKPGEKLVYRGIRHDRENERDISIIFQIGGEEAWQTTKYKTGGSITQQVYEGGIELRVQSTTDKDQDVLRGMSDTCYFGPGGLLFIEPTTIDDSPGIICTALYCQHCGTPMIRRGNCEWKTCEACRLLCEHEWERGMVHGGSVGDLGYDYFCSKCGVVKPKDPDSETLSLAEQHLQIEQNLGVVVFYSNLNMTPAEVVELERKAVNSKKEN